MVPVVRVWDLSLSVTVASLLASLKFSKFVAPSALFGQVGQGGHVILGHCVVAQLQYGWKGVSLLVILLVLSRFMQNPVVVSQRLLVLLQSLPL